MSESSELSMLESPAPEAPDAALTRIRKLRPQERLLEITRCLHSLSPTPMTETVFLRKALLRMRDATRLEIGEVTAAELQRENSPFAQVDFRQARINFHSRVQA